MKNASSSLRHLLRSILYRSSSVQKQTLRSGYPGHAINQTNEALPSLSRLDTCTRTYSNHDLPDSPRCAMHQVYATFTGSTFPSFVQAATRCSQLPSCEILLSSFTCRKSRGSIISQAQPKALLQSVSLVHKKTSKYKKQYIYVKHIYVHT